MLLEKRKNSIDFHQSVREQFIDICSPLQDLGIKDYYCFQSLKDGSTLLHVNRSDLAMEQFSTVTNEGDFYTELIENTSYEPIITFVTGDIRRFDSKKDPILHMTWRHDFWNVLTVMKVKEDNTFQGWGFSMGRNFQDPLGFFAERMPLIKRFIAYFDIVGADLIDMSDKRKLIPFDQEFHFHKKRENAALVKTSIEFLKKTSLKKLLLEYQGQPLEITKRQGQCLYFLALNFSTKEIGKVLDISPRTVEVFLQALKGKMKASSKRDLVNMVRDKKWVETLSLLT